MEFIKTGVVSFISLFAALLLLGVAWPLSIALVGFALWFTHRQANSE